MNRDVAFDTMLAALHPDAPDPEPADVATLLAAILAELRELRQEVAALRYLLD